MKTPVYFILTFTILLLGCQNAESGKEGAEFNEEGKGLIFHNLIRTDNCFIYSIPLKDEIAIYIKYSGQCDDIPDSFFKNSLVSYLCSDSIKSIEFENYLIRIDKSICSNLDFVLKEDLPSIRFIKKNESNVYCEYAYFYNQNEKHITSN